MTQFFKQEEKKPFSYSSIEMRKSSGNYRWIGVEVIILVVILLVYVLV